MGTFLLAVYTGSKCNLDCTDNKSLAHTFGAYSTFGNYKIMANNKTQLLRNARYAVISIYSLLT